MIVLRNRCQDRGSGNRVPQVNMPSARTGDSVAIGADGRRETAVVLLDGRANLCAGGRVMDSNKTVEPAGENQSPPIRTEEGISRLLVRPVNAPKLLGGEAVPKVNLGAAASQNSCPIWIEPGK